MEKKYSEEFSENDEGIELESFDDFIELTEGQKNSLEEELLSKNIDLKCDFFYNLENENFYKISKKDFLENYKRNCFYDLLVFAEEIENNEIFEFLVKNLSSADKYGKTALIYAIEENNKDAIEFFIAMGADVNGVDNDNKSPLMYAIEKGNKEIIEFLIVSLAEINTKDKNNRTPLMYAAISGNEEIVKLLITNGADINNKERESSGKNIVDFIEEKFKENINGLNRIILTLKEREKEIRVLGELLKLQYFKEVIENLDSIYTRQNLGNIQI